MSENLTEILFDPLTGKFISALVGVLIVIVLIRLLQRVVSARIHNQTARYALQKTLGFVSYLGILVVLVTAFSDRLNNITVALGVAGAGIAFALQEVIASIAGWIAISFGNFYRIGDRVQLGGIKGDVIDIGILRTSIMEIGEWVRGDLYNGRIVRIANSFVFKEPVFNYSGDFPFIWDEIVLPIKYGSDHRLARQILAEVAQEVVGEYVPVARADWEKMVNKYVIEDATVEPAVTMIATDNWLEFTLRYVVNYKRRRSTKDELFIRILDRIDQAPERIGIASTTFQLVDSSMNVNLRKLNT